MLDWRELLAHPLVLEAAWRRVLDWYRWGELRPDLELAQWRLRPADNLARLGEDFLQGRYSPRTPWPLIPYPKKGGALRHYCVPPVRDQVAFTAFGVLLAPLLETQMPSFSFGNRWFRAVGRKNDFQRNESRWEQRSFSLSDRALYQPYPRAHGLYRRVAHWTAAALLGAAVNEGEATGPALKIENYTRSQIPAFARKGWWQLRRSDRGLAFWAHLDLELAYPSVKVDLLRNRLEQLLKHEETKRLSRSKLSLDENLPFRASVAEYPPPIVEELVGDRGLHNRLQLASALSEHLSAVRYSTDLVSGDQTDLWKPPHTDQVLPTGNGSDHPGLPTGLAVSGLLMNAYLNPLDRGVAHFMEAGPFRRRCAFLRFSDDMTLLASDADGLVAFIEHVWESIVGPNAPPLAYPDPSLVGSNLRLNLAKVEPKSVATTIQRYLIAQRATDVSAKEPDCTCQCGYVKVPPEAPRPPLKFSAWWQDNQGDLTDLLGEALRPNKLGAFVTHLVERLSDLGSESILDRFGDAAKERLVDLHGLIRLDFDDAQVRKDTRLVFAANRLARAWMPRTEIEEQRRTIGAIRDSIRHALGGAPWKFKLWRPLVQAAVRRPFGAARDSWLADDHEATEWMNDALRLVALVAPRRGHGESWREVWPDRSKNTLACWAQDGKRFKNRVDAIADQSASSHRVWFWLALAITIRDLGRAVDGDWSTESWAFRAVPEEQAVATLDWLGSIDSWAQVLYGSQVHDLRISLLERHALALAVIARTQRMEMIDSVERAIARGSLDFWDAGAQEPFLPDALPIFRGASRTRAILFGRSERSSKKNSRSADRLWETVLLARHQAADSRSLAAVLQEVTAQSGDDYRLGTDLLSVADALGILRSLPGMIDHLDVTPMGDEPQTTGAAADLSRWRRLHSYRLKRELMLAGGPAGPSSPSSAESGELARRPTIHRVLWGSAHLSTDLNAWTVTPFDTPSVGLPTRVSLCLLEAALSAPPAVPEDWAAARTPPAWIIHDRAKKLLARGRRLQLGVEPTERHDESLVFGSTLVIGRDPSAWEIPPHPVFYSPWVRGLTLSTRQYETWCHVLLFFTALDGDERFLDALFRYGIKAVPFEERWDLRTRIHLPPVLWRLLDRIVRSPESDSPATTRADLLDCVRRFVDGDVTLDDFVAERVDVSLNLRSDFESARHVAPLRHGRSDPPKLPDELQLKPDILEDRICVRVGQVSAHPDWSSYLARFPNLSQSEINRLTDQIQAVLLAANTVCQGDDHGSGLPLISPSVVILPEVTLPSQNIAPIRKLVSERRQALLVGKIWREVPTPYRPHISRQRTRRYVVNEALLFVPMATAQPDGLPLVRTFTIRKPIPAHGEQGLVAALTARSQGRETWSMLCGRRWYRFVHPKWGDFTVAICSDLLDPSPWVSMRGQLLHLFMSAYNQDVDLYEALTWVRAYENYVNVAVANHGEHGGSFVWTPKHNHDKEIARVRGDNLFVVADVVLPVLELFDAQKNGLAAEVLRAQMVWSGLAGFTPAKFKAPPPGYPGRR